MICYLSTGDGYALYSGDVAGSGNGYGDTEWGFGGGDGAQGDDGYEDGNGRGDGYPDAVKKSGDGP